MHASKLHHNGKLIEELKKLLNVTFKLKDLGISISQRHYTLQILEVVGLLGAKPMNVSMDPNVKLRNFDQDLLSDPSSYRRLIGRLIYLTISRLDIVSSVNKLSQFVAKPCKAHLSATHHLLGYLKSALGQGIFISSAETFQLRAFADSNWASCPNTRKSTFDFCIFIGNSLVSWESKK
ncbi:uncharacterized mitochondrial protein AtMg00810-like [Benincasa hispida]|uniref:uncharacterized mitochondrial protein AtMg00810-like n=1 Tax=Benincasa hispida TaxID=102211 RepID=UPI00190189D5|nr:uncharacterized mitochondrial protein AtMg00810-like [Benincasa hispida]